MVEKKIVELTGLPFPPVTAPIGSYVPALQVGDLVFTSGQIPMKAGKLLATGKIGKELTEDQGAELSKICVYNCLNAVKSVIGDLEKIERVVKLTAFVNSAPGFYSQPKVANGASDFLLAIFGEKGKHARAAVGVAELPLNAPVEIELIAQIKKDL